MADHFYSTRYDFYVYALFREDGLPFYVGKGHGNRWFNHEMMAAKGAKGHKYEIIRKMQARGIEIVKVKIHENLDEATSHAYEIALIKAIGRKENGPLVNLTDGGDGVTGFKHPPGKKLPLEVIAKIAASNRGKKRTPEHIAKRSAARRGKKLSDQSKANISAGQKGRKKSPQECANISKGKLGTKASAQARINMSIAHFGKTLSADTKAKMSATKRGKKHSPEHTAKLAAIRRGQKFSPEWRLALSLAHIGYKPTAQARVNMSDAKKGVPWSEARRAAYVRAKTVQ